MVDITCISLELMDQRVFWHMTNTQDIRFKFIYSPLRYATTMSLVGHKVLGKAYPRNPVTTSTLTR